MWQENCSFRLVGSLYCQISTYHFDCSSIQIMQHFHWRVVIWQIYGKRLVHSYILLKNSLKRKQKKNPEKKPLKKPSLYCKNLVLLSRSQRIQLWKFEERMEHQNWWKKIWKRLIRNHLKVLIRDLQSWGQTCCQFFLGPSIIL